MGADPLTMMAFSMAASAVTGVMGGMAAKKSGAANQGMADYNAALIRSQKIKAKQKANFDANRIRSAGERLKSAQRTGFAKGGVQMTGTPLEVLGNTAADIEYDAQLSIYAGELDANAFEAQAVLKGYEGKIAKFKGDTQAKSAYVGAGVSLLGAGYAASGSTGVQKFSGSPSTASMPHYEY